MKKILIPTDFSANARNAMEYAISMFSYDNVEYTLLNVYAEPDTGSDVLVSISDLLLKESKKGLKKEYDYLRRKFTTNSLTIKQRSEYGWFASTVHKITEEEDFDFVVIGTKGASGLRKFLIGSNTGDIVNKAKCPRFNYSG